MCRVIALALSLPVCLSVQTQPFGQNRIYLLSTCVENGVSICTAYLKHLKQCLYGTCIMTPMVQYHYTEQVHEVHVCSSEL